LCSGCRQARRHRCLWCFLSNGTCFPNSYESLQESCAAQLTVPPPSGKFITQIIRVSRFTVPLRRPLHTPADDAGYAETAIHHFHDKLLHIRDRLKTEAGKRLGDSRHQVVSASLSSWPWKKSSIRLQLLEFLASIDQEYEGKTWTPGVTCIQLEKIRYIWTWQILQLFSIVQLWNAGSPFCVTVGSSCIFRRIPRKKKVSKGQNEVQVNGGVVGS
jgi:hypothetical protein